MPQGPNDFKSGINELRKMFKEYSKQSKDLRKAWDKQVKQERKHHKDQLRDVEKLHRKKLKMFRDESRAKEKLAKREFDIKLKEDRLKRRQRREDKQERNDIIRHKKQEHGILRRTLGTVAKAGAFAGGGLLGLLVGGTMRRYQMEKQKYESMAPAIGLGRIANVVGRSGRAGVPLGFNAMQRAQLIPQMARATGENDPTSMMQAMRAFGMQSGEVGQVFGTIRRSGSTFGKGGQGPRQFVELMAAGVASGIERGRLPEFFKGVTTLLEQQQSLVAGAVDITGVARMQGALGLSGVAAFQGQRGAQFMAKIQQGIMAPKGDPNKALMLQAMGYGVPGSGVDYYSAEKMREQGATPENVRKVIKEVQRQFGGGPLSKGTKGYQDASLRLRQAFGTGLDQNEKFLDLYNSGNWEKFQATVGRAQKGAPTLAKEAKDKMKESGAGRMLERYAYRFDELAHLPEHLRKAVEKWEDTTHDIFMALASAIKDLVGAIRDLNNRFKGDKDIAKPAKDIPKLKKAMDVLGTSSSIKEQMKAAKQWVSSARGWKRSGKAPEGIDFMRGPGGVLFSDPRSDVTAGAAAHTGRVNSELFEARAVANKFALDLARESGLKRLDPNVRMQLAKIGMEEYYRARDRTGQHASGIIAMKKIMRAQAATILGKSLPAKGASLTPTTPTTAPGGSATGAGTLAAAAASPGNLFGGAGSKHIFELFFRAPAGVSDDYVAATSRVDVNGNT